MAYRLDLQNRRDFIDDARRGVNNARNDLLADLDLAASAVPTGIIDDTTGVNFDLQDTTYRASIVFGLPIDRTIERSNLRQSQVDLERSVRDYEQFRDTVAVQVRAAVRNIDRALFSQALQQENLRVSHLRVAQIDAAPDRADARDRTEAATGLLGAQDAYLQARRDLQIAILLYLLDSGQLRLEADGTIRPLNGMELREDEPLDYGLGDPGPAGPAP
jgi:outer membrane protein TolC